jgi:hypothetical protein
MEMMVEKVLSQKKSSEVRLGQISEQMAPFLQEFPYDPKKAHFIGMPIDYIVFNDDEIVFLEVKSGGAGLSQKQRQIKDLVARKQIIWKELKISGKLQTTPKVQSEICPTSSLPGLHKDVPQAGSQGAQSDQKGAATIHEQDASGSLPV